MLAACDLDSDLLQRPQGLDDLLDLPLEPGQALCPEDCAPFLVVTNRGVRAGLSPAMTALDRFSRNVGVWPSRTALSREYAHTASHNRGSTPGSQPAPGSSCRR